MSRMDEVENMSQREIDVVFWDKMDDELRRGNFTVCGASEIARQCKRHQTDTDPSKLKTSVTALGAGVLALLGSALAVKGMQEATDFTGEVLRSFRQLRG